jgi:hypothetical protein
MPTHDLTNHHAILVIAKLGVYFADREKQYPSELRSRSPLSVLAAHHVQRRIAERAGALWSARDHT